MKKLDAILNGKALTATKIDIKKRSLKRVLEAMTDSAKSQKEDASINYDKLTLQLGEDGANLESIVKKMVENKSTVMKADNTLKVLEAIQADLDEEVKE